MITKLSNFRRIYYYFKHELELNNFDEIIQLELLENGGIDIYFTHTGEILLYLSSPKAAYKMLSGIIRSIKNGTFYEYY